MSLEEAIRNKAHELGFDLVGFADATEPLEADFARYEAFVDAGMHGEMHWLAEHREVRRRLDTSAILEGARSVVCVAQSYAGEDGPTGGITRHISKYARGQDYHGHLRKKLRKLAAFVASLQEGARARAMIDTAPVLERAWAARAGLGFVGKNGMLIAPGLGSYVLIGEVVTTLALTPGTPIGERCGSCTACLDACPTDAFEAPYVLDARKCISYLTIELRGPMPMELREGVGNNLFGCDACQSVCPFNKGASSRRTMPQPYQPLPRWKELSLEAIARLDETDWKEVSQGSPLYRATYAGLVRNAITVLANLGDPKHAGLFEELAREHPDPTVRDHAVWALAKLRREEMKGTDSARGPRVH